MKTEIRQIALAFAFAGATLNSLAQSADFDVSRDFSSANNPNGAWLFGWAGTVSGAVTPLTVQHVSGSANGVQIPSWQLTHGEAPVVYCNTSGQTAVIGGGVAQMAPGEVWFDGGQDGAPQNFVVIQFTAPTNGDYVVATAVRPVYNGWPQGDADFHVVKNGTELFGIFLSPTQSTTYTNTVALGAGDTIKFLLGHGADGLEYGSIYRIAAQINPGSGVTNPPPPPPPPPLTNSNNYEVGRDFSAVDNPNGVWNFGWTPTIGGVFTPLTVRHTSPTESGVLVPSWQLTHGEAPVVYCNTSSVPAIFGGGGASMPPGAVWFAPGQDGRPENFAVIQFTAPTSSNYLVEAAASPVYNGWPQGDTDFHVVKNSAELFGRFLSPSQSASFSNVITLQAGETIQFVLGRGADGREYGSSLRLAAVITPTSDEPTVITNPPPEAPMIVTQPTPYQAIAVGSTAHLSVVAWGSGALSYQWLFGDTELSGATAASLDIANFQAANAGSYRAVVSSPFGSVTSIVAVLAPATNNFGSGTILFANSSTNRIYDLDGTTLLPSGSNFVAGLYMGFTAANLQLVSGLGSFIFPGRFNGGIRNLPGTTAGQTVWMQIKVWDNADGVTCEEAVAAEGKTGASTIFQVTLGGGIAPPALLSAMPGFALTQAGSPSPVIAASPAPVRTIPMLRRLLRTAEGWRLTFTGSANTTCAIETSTDLRTWTTVAYVVNESGIVDYTHNDTAGPMRFYRIGVVNE